MQYTASAAPPSVPGLSVLGTWVFAVPSEAQRFHVIIFFKGSPALAAFAMSARVVSIESLGEVHRVISFLKPAPHPWGANPTAHVEGLLTVFRYFE